MDLIALRQKKAHIMEIQINGGTVADKVWAVVVVCLALLLVNRWTGPWTTLRRQYRYLKYSARMR